MARTQNRIDVVRRKASAGADIQMIGAVSLAAARPLHRRVFEATLQDIVRFSLNFLSIQAGRVSISLENRSMMSK